MSGPVFIDAIAAHAAQSPGSPCVEDEHGQYTYGEVWRGALAVAENLHAQGVRPGERVVTAMGPSAPHLAAILGVMASGAVCVPLNTRFTSVEAGAFLAPLTPRMAITDPAHAGLVADLPHAVLDRSILRRPSTSDSELRFRPAPGDPAMVIGTGGTTGEPKGAIWTHQGLWLYAASCQAQMEIRRTDVELYFSPFFHIALATTVFAVLFAGGSVMLAPKFDEGRVLGALASGRPTRLFGAPTALLRLMDHPGFAPELTRSVRRVLFGSTVSAPGFPRRLGAGFPAAELITGYGATEFGAVARRRSWEADVVGESAVGRAVPGARIAVVDPSGEPVPPGTVGAIRVRAPWQMLGYWGHPPVAGGWIDSGDLGRLDESGCLHLAGRAKDMVITGGENVFPVEVETVLARHPQVSQAAVFGVADPLWGERVEAAVVLSAGATVSADGLAAHCRGMLAGYKVPRAFHVMDALPLTAAMKVDKRRLREVTGDA